MASPLPQKTAMGFGPYGNANAALMHCQSFISAGFSPDDARGLGIVWVEPAGAAVLRPPFIDQDSGLGASLIVQYHGPQRPPEPSPPSGFSWQSIEDTVRGVYERIGTGIHGASGALTNADNYLQQKLGPVGAPVVESLIGMQTLIDLRTDWRFVERELAAHPKLAAVASTVLDVIGVVGAVVGIAALAPEILTVTGALAIGGAVVAGVSSAVLTYADAKDSYLLIKGDQAGTPPDETAAAKWERSDFFRRTELLAPLLVLPDAVRSGAGVAREISEASDAARLAGEKQAVAAANESRAATRVGDQEAANALKRKIPAAQKQRLQTLISSEKNAIKKLKRANKIMDVRKRALQEAIHTSILHDGPGLVGTAAGTGLYVGHLPDMVQSAREKKSSPAPVSTSPLGRLMPRTAGPACAPFPYYFSFSLSVSTPLQGP